MSSADQLIFQKRVLDFFQSLNHVDMNLKPQFLIKSVNYIVPSPSTTLGKEKEGRSQRGWE